jgi:hypothetical protein
VQHLYRGGGGLESAKCTSGAAVVRVRLCYMLAWWRHKRGHDWVVKRVAGHKGPPGSSTDRQGNEGVPVWERTAGPVGELGHGEGFRT